MLNKGDNINFTLLKVNSNIITKKIWKKVETFLFIVVIFWLKSGFDMAFFFFS